MSEERTKSDSTAKDNESESDEHETSDSEKERDSERPSISSEVAEDKEETQGPEKKETKAELIEERPRSVQIDLRVTRSRHPLDVLEYEALAIFMEELKTESRHLETENRVFQNFLERNDPQSLEGMRQFIRDGLRAKQPEPTPDNLKLTWSGMMPEKNRIILTNVPASQTSIIGVRQINLTTKTDMVLHEMEDIQLEMSAVVKKFKAIRSKLDAELEELGLRETGIRDTLNTFVEQVVIGGMDKISQKITPEKYARFFNEQLKRGRTSADKLRLRFGSLKVQYQKLCSIYTQKQLVGERVQAVDFEQLVIENNHQVETFEQKTKLLHQMKKIYGISNLSVSKITKKLIKKVEDMDKLKKMINAKKVQIDELDQECYKASMELDHTQHEYEALKLKSDTFTAPDVVDYLKLKEHVDELNREIKLWTRKNQSRETSLALSIQSMKRLTNSKVPRASWFEVVESDASSRVGSFDWATAERVK